MDLSFKKPVSNQANQIKKRETNFKKFKKYKYIYIYSSGAFHAKSTGYRTVYFFFLSYIVGWYEKIVDTNSQIVLEIRIGMTKNLNI